MQQILKPLEDRINQFYLLAFLPLIIMAYFSAVRTVIPMYGFILLLIKKDKLTTFNKPNNLQKTLGIMLIVVSIFAYYPTALLFPELADPYGTPNYVVHLLGLFLVFFNPSALKEAFTPLFLIVAATSSFFISEALQPLLSPVLIPTFMRLMESLLVALRLPITTNYDTRLIILHTWKGSVVTIFDWGCIGVYSTLVFSIILVVILAEEKSSIRTKLLWATAGVIGTNIVNVFRILTIFLTDFAYGKEAGAQVHYFIGYLLFITWITLFLFIMAKKPFTKKKASAYSTIHQNSTSQNVQKQQTKTTI